MTVLMVSTAPDRPSYDKVAGIVDLVADRPAGLVLHAASELPDGSVQIVDVWESAEHAEAFGRDRIFPAFAAAGVLEQMTNQPPPVPYPTIDMVR